MKHDWEIEGWREIRHGRLLLGGVDAGSLAEREGTPLFVFSERRIRGNVHRLTEAARSAFKRTKLCYAAKANSLSAVLRAVRTAGADIEVNSGGELYKALHCGFLPEQIVFNGVSKTDEEIGLAAGRGIYAINVDSLYELEQIARVSRRLGRRANVTLRMVPEIGTRSHIGLQTALLTSKFGMSPEHLPEAIRFALDEPSALRLAGVHIHVGSQTPDPGPYIDAFSAMWRHLVSVYEETGFIFGHINLGGGVPVRYLYDGSALSLPKKEREMLEAELDTGETLRQAVSGIDRLASDQVNSTLREKVELVLEPGRSVIADAGVLLTRIRNIKHRPETGETWLMVDAGYELLLSMTNYKWYYHMVAAERTGEPHTARYKVAGPLCDSGDVYFDIEGKGRLPDYRLLPEAMKPGDVLALLNAGAYTMSQMTAYNGRPLPAAVMVTMNHHPELIRRRDTFEDLLLNEV
ncbi:MAG: diaminopimelate decarboxylase [Acidobacteria bacterium]|nr:diaminopimelate decarboxylase [Acidobacteriota bacterium]